ncbi:MAG TPA: phosphatase PAP2 family protein [Mobilitalea sp.]|nr:phosphatase PAP2 family protein [Mobilitalea sp.]
MFQYLYNLDVNILLFIQEYIRYPVLTPIFKLITILGNGGMIWLIIILGLLLYKKSRTTGMVSLIAFAMSILINNIILKNVIARPRPFAALTQLQVLIARPTDFSFPSGHTATAFAVAGAIYFMGNKRWGIGALIFAGLMGFSRLYLGVHYPSDVLCGAIVGLLISISVNKVQIYLQEKQKLKTVN